MQDFTGQHELQPFTHFSKANNQKDIQRLTRQTIGHFATSRIQTAAKTKPCENVSLCWKVPSRQMLDLQQLPFLPQLLW